MANPFTRLAMLNHANQSSASAPVGGQTPPTLSFGSFNPTTPTSPFTQPPAPQSIFGQSQTQPVNTQTTSPFGQPNIQPLFGQQPTSMFGQPATTNTAGSMFGQSTIPPTTASPNTGFSFGNSQNTTSNPTVTGTSPFSTTATIKPAAPFSNLFGANTAPAQTSPANTPSFGTFASTGTVQPAPTFGFNSTTTSLNPFATSATTSPFQTQAPTTTLTATPSVPAANPFNLTQSNAPLTPFGSTTPKAAQASSVFSPSPASSPAVIPSNVFGAVPTTNAFAAAPTTNVFGSSPTIAPTFGSFGTSSGTAPTNTLKSGSIPNIFQSARTAVPPTQTASSPANTPLVRSSPVQNGQQAVAVGAKIVSVPDMEARLAVLKEEREVLRKRLTEEGILPPEGDDKADMEDMAPIIGTCTDMCPEFERLDRQYTMMVSGLESAGVKEAGILLIDHTKAVKAYARAAAGGLVPLPQDVRTPQTLVRSNDYLIQEILQKNEHSPPTNGAVYAFIRDRFRAIRKDFKFQKYNGSELVYCLEAQIRYLIWAGYSHSVFPTTEFSQPQHLEQLMESMSSLMEAYNSTASSNEAEFRSYFVLLRMLDADIFRRMDTEISKEIMMTPQMWNAWRLVLNSQHNMNRGHQPTPFLFQFSVIFQDLASERTTYLAACITWRQNISIRRRAMLMMMHASSSQLKTSLRLEDVAELLWFDDLDQAKSFLECYGLAAEKDDEDVLRIRFKDPVGNANCWKEPDITSAPKPMISKKLVHAKWPEGSISDLILGRTSNIGVNSSTATRQSVNIVDPDTLKKLEQKKAEILESQARQREAAKKAEETNRLQKEAAEKRRQEELRAAEEKKQREEQERIERERLQREREQAEAARLEAFKKARDAALAKIERSLTEEVYKRVTNEMLREEVEKTFMRQRQLDQIAQELCQGILNDRSNARAEVIEVWCDARWYHARLRKALSRWRQRSQVRFDMQAEQRRTTEDLSRILQLKEVTLCREGQKLKRSATEHDLSQSAKKKVLTAKELDVYWKPYDLQKLLAPRFVEDNVESILYTITVHASRAELAWIQHKMGTSVCGELKVDLSQSMSSATDLAIFAIPPYSSNIQSTEHWQSQRAAIRSIMESSSKAVPFIIANFDSNFSSIEQHLDKKVLLEKLPIQPLSLTYVDVAGKQGSARLLNALQISVERWKQECARYSQGITDILARKKLDSRPSKPKFSSRAWGWMNDVSIECKVKTRKLDEKLFALFSKKPLK